MGYTDFQIVVKDNIRLRIFDQTADIVIMKVAGNIFLRK
jgi:hypothetical protein